MTITRKEAIQILSTRDWSGMLCGYTSGYTEALDMAIEALSKPNYESDTEVRLAVTNRKKDKVILWDAFGEVEYYPHGEINCVKCEHYYETEEDWGVEGHCRQDTAHLSERTGEWILVCDSEGEGDNLYRCSECGCEYGCQEYDKPNFCLDCGAKMFKKDGESK